MSDRIETSLMPKDELVEVVPYGVTAVSENVRPVLLFKEKSGKEIFPVWLSPLDAGIAISQHHIKTPANSPHDLTAKIFKTIGISLSKCVFTEVRGHHQYMDLYFSGHPEIAQVRSRADQCLSFCLHERAQFFCSRSFMAECRDQDAELEGVARGMNSVPSLGQNHHPYLM